ncbi:MAG TPA: FtsQ-type POTRA domain-containing protein [Vicinamibacterales bacterium]|nr:FtsQ-type POTRA domain-containing protein [Vicinamibacterales bacterium]
MSVKVPAEKNFRRAKVKPVKNRTERRWISWRVLRVAIPAVLAVYATYRTFDLVLNASTLQVRRIAVRGNVRLSSGEVQALVDDLRGTSILTADLARYRSRLMESPWVADVALRRVLPSTIEVFVSERRPIGLCRLGNQLYLLDRTAAIIDEYGPQYAEFDLPIIDGVVRAPSSGEPLIDDRRTELAARVIDALAPHKALATRVSQIDVTNAHDAVLLLEGDAALLHLGGEKFAERLQSYVELAPTLRERVPDMDYVDLRFDDRLYVRPVGAATAQAAPAAAAAAAPSGTPGAAAAAPVRPKKQAAQDRGARRSAPKARPAKPGQRR